MATSGQVNTNSITTSKGNKWYVETNWWINSWSGNTATIGWNAILRRSAGSNAKVNSWGLSGNVNSHSWSIASGTQMSKDQTLGSGTFTLSGGSTVTGYCSGAIYGAGYTVYASQSWTLDNNVTTPTVTCSVTQGLNTLGASLTVTNNGGASIVSQGIRLYSDSGCTTQVKAFTGTSGTFTGLTPNTTYYARAYAYNGTFTGYSAVRAVTTYNKATITTASDINHGDNLVVSYANPSSSTLAIGIYKGDTPIASDRTCTGTSYTFTFTDTELDTIYREYGNGNTQTVRVILKTANTYEDYKDITITLTGNQKTMREKVEDTWKRGKVFIKVNGTWKNGVIWQKVDGTWKRGI